MGMGKLYPVSPPLDIQLKRTKGLSLEMRSKTAMKVVVMLGPKDQEKVLLHGIIQRTRYSQISRYAPLRRYNENIKTPLLQHLDSSMSEFFVVLVIVVCPGKDDIPAVLIIHDAKIDEPLPNLTELPIQDTEYDDFVFLLVDGDADMCAGEIDIPYNRIYQTHQVSGSSIEAKQCGTVGLFIEESDNKYVGITCAHMAGSTAEQLDVLGPCLEDFCTYVAALREQKSECEKEIAESKNLITKYERTKLLDFVKSELQIIEPLAGMDEERAKNIRLGKVRTSEYEVVNFRG